MSTPIVFHYAGQPSNEIPRNVTLLIIDSSVTEIPAGEFENFEELVEVQCHEGLQVIGERAFAPLTNIPAKNFFLINLNNLSSNLNL